MLPVVLPPALVAMPGRLVAHLPDPRDHAPREVSRVAAHHVVVVLFHFFLAKGNKMHACNVCATHVYIWKSSGETSDRGQTVST